MFEKDMAVYKSMTSAVSFSNSSSSPLHCSRTVHICMLLTKMFTHSFIHFSLSYRQCQ